jgi:hypothetical protein
MQSASPTATLGTLGRMDPFRRARRGLTVAQRAGSDWSSDGRD